jgi:hypothetical protein
LKACFEILKGHTRKSRGECEEKEKEKLVGTKPNNYLPHTLPHPQRPLFNE